MTLMSGLGVVLSLVFGCLLLALVAELYYLLWWKKQIITSSNSNSNNNNSNRFDEDFSNHTKEIFYLFCCSTNNNNINNHPNSSRITANPPVIQNSNPDLEMGLESNKDLLWKALGEEGVESELMRLRNLGGPPRFLFTIKEETKEDLESEDGKSKCGADRSRSLGELIAALESHTPFLSPIASPLNTGLKSPIRDICLEGADSGYLQSPTNVMASPLNMGLKSPTRDICLEGADNGYLQSSTNVNSCNNFSPMASPLNKGLKSPTRGFYLEGADNGYLQGGNNVNYSYKNNPLFESSVEAEMFRLRSSPPPKFKFLRDAEEKLCRRLLEEAQKSGVLQKLKEKVVL